MPTDDEFRRVAEDVRALARSLARDIRGGVARARDDTRERGLGLGGLSAVERAGREELRRAREALRQTARLGHRRHHHHHHHHHRTSGPGWLDSRETEPGVQPRSDKWGRRGRDRGHRPGADPEEGLDAGPALQSRRDTRPLKAARRPPRPKAASLPLRHRHDGSTLIGLLAVVFGLAWLAAGTHLLQVSAEGVLAVALMVLGLSMAVTARTDWALSRRSWPVVAGAALVLAMLVSSTTGPLGRDLRNAQFGSSSLQITKWSDVPAKMQGNIGSTVIDMTSLSLPPPAGHDLTVHGAMGAVLIELPMGLNADIDGHVGLGSVEVGAVKVSGFRQSYHQHLGPTVGTPFPMHVDSRFGTVRIVEGLPSAASGAEPAAPPLPPKEPTGPTVPTP